MYEEINLNPPFFRITIINRQGCENGKKMKILEIKRQPSWKFWKIDQWEVTVKVNGETKKLSIYAGPPLIEKMFLDFVRYKALHGDQFWDIHQLRKAEKKTKEQKKAKEQKMSNELQTLVGRELSL